MRFGPSRPVKPRDPALLPLLRGPGDASDYGDWEVRAYTSAGARKLLPQDRVSTAYWEVTERGGWSVGGLQLVQTITDTGQLAAGDRIDIWLYGSLAYRGWVSVAQNEIAEAERSSPTLQSLATTLSQWRVRRAYAWDDAVDLSTVFSAICTDAVAIAGRLPALVVSVATIGVTVHSFDARGKSVSEAFGQLCDLAPYQCIWGVDADSMGADRAYLRTRPTTVARRYVVGGNVDAFVYPRDASAIVNRLYLKGGKVDQPNLLTNGSFEDVRRPDTITSSLIWDGGLENYGGTGSSWGVTGDAGVVTCPLSGYTAHGGVNVAHVGWYAGASATASLLANGVGIDPADTYTCKFWGKRKTAATAANVRVTAALYDAGLNLLGTVTGAWHAVTSAWAEYTTAIDPTAYTTAVTLVLSIESDPANAAGGGALIDDIVWFRDARGGTQAGWELYTMGAAQCVDVDLADTDYRHGARSVFLQTLGVVNPAVDFAGIRTHPTAKVPMQYGQLYTAGIWYTTRGNGPATVVLGVQTGNSTYTTATETADPSGWNLLAIPFLCNAPGVTTSPDPFEMYVYVASDSQVWFDCAFLVQQDTPADWVTDGGYWSGDTYERTIDVTDAGLSGLIAGVATSITDYGEREAELTQSDVIDYATCCAFAGGYFNANALPKVQARLNLVALSASDLPDQAGSVKLLNLPSANAIPALYPSRYRVTIGEAVTVDADLGNEGPTLAGLLRELQRRQP